ncbi:MAG: 16S rRNA (cytidine(1402)-2'-O)-methyltransferase, partial [Oscillospiraceae bacterium]
VSALCISALSTSRFAFEGFLSTNKRNRQLHLESLKNDPHTLIFYEAPHKLLTTLKDMYRIFGNRKISLGRELTKIHEEIIRTDLEQAISLYESKLPKGEFVLILEGAAPIAETKVSLEDAIAEAKDLVDAGEKATDVAKRISAQYGYKKSEIYNGLISLLLPSQQDET